uniref:Uncharacterized protein n=1 Tax=Rhizophora mucronata TaxID=61149 RepID=A0A2P2NDM7_RHIMU
MLHVRRTVMILKVFEMKVLHKLKLNSLDSESHYLCTMNGHIKNNFN